jgi:S-disulfanyl-L-cysteine oxidoreductase SoxD
MRTVALLSLLASLASGQTVSVNDGVYTEAQARRGETIYGANCSGCHGDALQGKSDGPLRGAVFMDRWREDSLNVVFQHMRTLMPARAPASLPETAYIDVLALVLEANRFPPGSKELTAAAIPGVLLVGRDGPQPLPTNATVRVAGCLTPGANEIWTLTNARTPMRTQTGDEITAAETDYEKTLAPGTGSFRLQNLDEFMPEKLTAHRVLVKGVLNRVSSGDRIHVLAMASIAAECAK